MKVSLWKDLESELQSFTQKFSRFSTASEDAVVAEKEAFRKEREFLLKRIFNTQEQLTKLILDYEVAKQKLTANSLFVKRLYAQNPHLSSGLEMEVCEVGDGSGRETLQWCLKDLFLGEQFFSELQFKTFLDGSMAGILFTRYADSAESIPLMRWPGTGAIDKEVRIIPTVGSFLTGSNEVLTNLGSTDWRTLNALVDVLIDVFAYSTESHIPIEIASAYATGLSNLKRSLRGWPSVLRFDKVSHHLIKRRGAYSALEIHLENVSQGDRHWPLLKYAIASVDGPLGEFGYHPRIEIFEEQVEFLESWVMKKSADIHDNFELRFSLPDDMDIPLWRSLSEADQIRIASLISCMPNHVSQIRFKAPAEDWDKWIELCSCIKQIFSKRLYDSSSAAR